MFSFANFVEIISNNIFSTQNIFLLSLIFATAVLSFIFTPSWQLSKKIIGIISAITIATIAIFFTTNIFLFAALSLLVLMLTFFTVSSSGDRKIVTIYALGMMLKISLLALTLLIFKNDERTFIFYILLFPFLGLFPFQSWYIKFFEKAPFGTVVSFIAFQAIVILNGEAIFKLENFNEISWLLAAAALVSSILAIIQTEPRRLLAYFTSSQLAFLAFSHLTNSATMNLGSFYMTLSFLGATTTFIALIAALEARQGLATLSCPNGTYDSYPKLAFWLLFFGLVSSGLPLSVGYIAEDLIFEGSFEAAPIVDIAWLLAIAINTIIVVKIFLFLCQGASAKEKNLDLRRHEITALTLIATIVFLATIY